MFYTTMTDAELQELANGVNKEVQRRVDFRSRIVSIYSDSPLNDLQRDIQITRNRLSHRENVEDRITIDVLEEMVQNILIRA